MELDYFYCMSCRQLLPVKMSSVLFKTGFFRNAYPLGCCVSCSPRIRMAGGEPMDEAEAAPSSDVKFS